jgi:hypothetical protein
LLSNLESVRPHPQRRAAGIIVTRTNFGVFVLSTTRIIYLKSRLTRRFQWVSATLDQTAALTYFFDSLP